MDLDKKTVEKLEKGGFIRSKFHDYQVINECFREARKENGYCTAMVITMDACNTSEETVRRAYRAFKKMDE